MGWCMGSGMFPGIGERSGEVWCSSSEIFFIFFGGGLKMQVDLHFKDLD